MISRNWLSYGLALCAGIVGAFGIGPVFVTAKSDLLPHTATLSNLTTAFIVVIGALSATLFLLWRRRLSSNSKRKPSPKKLLMIYGLALLLSSIGWTLASVVDASNTSAWRHTRVLIPEPGIDKQISIEDRLHHSRLRIGREYKYGDEIATSPVMWSVWLIGGKAELLVRISQLEKAASVLSCSDRGEVTIEARTSEIPITSVTVPVFDLCNKWRRIEFALPPQITEIKFLLSGESENLQNNRSLDVAILGMRPNFSPLWTICTITVFGLLLTLPYFSLAKVRELSFSGPDQAIIKTDTRKVSGVIIIVAILLFLIVGNTFVYWYVSQERTIYTWDYGGYWTSSRHVSQVLRGDSSSTSIDSGTPAIVSLDRLRVDESDRPTLSRDPLTSLIRNVRYSEYNITSNLPVAVAMVLFSGSRMVYELSLTNAYALVAVLVLLVALMDFAKDSVHRWTQWWPIIPVLIVLCFVPFWVPLIRGYIGVCVVAVNLTVLWLYFMRSANNAKLPTLAFIGLLLVVGVLLQRWNAYWVIAFLLITFVDGAKQLLAVRSLHIDHIIQCFQVPIVLGCVAFVTLAVVAWPLVVTMSTTDYTDIYSAYVKHTNLFTAIVELNRSFGLVLLLLVVFAAGYLMSRSSTRRFATLLSIQLIVIFIHFSSTQTMGPHHLYVLMPGVFLVLSIAAIEVTSNRRLLVSIVGVAALILYVANGIGSGLAVFAPSGESVRSMLIPLVPETRRIPLVRKDIDEFGRLAKYIDYLVDSDLRTNGIYVLSSSQTLNAGHLRKLEVSTGIKFRSVDKLLPSAHVDKRDGFPRRLLEADLVIVGEPIQYHRRPSDQQVVGIPADSLLEGSGIGAAFERMPVSFELDGFVKVVVFERVRPNTAEEIRGLSDKLKKFYPGRPNVYEQ